MCREMPASVPCQESKRRGMPPSVPSAGQRGLGRWYKGPVFSARKARAWYTGALFSADGRGRIQAMARGAASRRTLVLGSVQKTGFLGTRDVDLVRHPAFLGMQGGCGTAPRISRRAGRGCGTAPRISRQRKRFPTAPPLASNMCGRSFVSSLRQQRNASSELIVKPKNARAYKPSANCKALCKPIVSRCQAPVMHPKPRASLGEKPVGFQSKRPAPAGVGQSTGKDSHVHL